MTLKQNILKIVEKINKMKEHVTNETQTKNSFIHPFLFSLGYDVSDPFIVKAENSADVATKNGKRVDYCIFKDSKAIFLLECKPCNTELNIKHTEQLCNYFHVKDVKFGILTNGIEYQFFSDFNKINVMDTTPFLTINLENENHINNEHYLNILEMFSYEHFDVNKIYQYVSEYRDFELIQNRLYQELNSPSEQFIKLLINDISTAKQPTSYYEKLIKKALNQYFKLPQKEVLNIEVSNYQKKSSKTENIQPILNKSENTKLFFGELKNSKILIGSSISQLFIGNENILNNIKWSKAGLYIFQYFWKLLDNQQKEFLYSHTKSMFFFEHDKTEDYQKKFPKLDEKYFLNTRLNIPTWYKQLSIYIQLIDQLLQTNYLESTYIYVNLAEQND